MGKTEAQGDSVNCLEYAPSTKASWILLTDSSKRLKFQTILGFYNRYGPSQSDTLILEIMSRGLSVWLRFGGQRMSEPVLQSWFSDFLDSYYFHCTTKDLKVLCRKNSGPWNTRRTKLQRRQKLKFLYICFGFMFDIWPRVNQALLIAWLRNILYNSSEWVRSLLAFPGQVGSVSWHAVELLNVYFPVLSQQFAESFTFSLWQSFNAVSRICIKAEGNYCGLRHYG